MLHVKPQVVRALDVQGWIHPLRCGFLFVDFVPHTSPPHVLPTHIPTPPFGPGEEKQAAFGPGKKRRPAMPSAPSRLWLSKKTH